MTFSSDNPVNTNQLPISLDVDPQDRETVACKFGIAEAMAAEIVYENDEGAGYWAKETPEQRYSRMRKWVEASIINN